MAVTKPTKSNNPTKESSKVQGLSLTKVEDKYEVAVKFTDGSSFVFSCEFKTNAGCIATVGIGDVSGVGKYN